MQQIISRDESVSAEGRIRLLMGGLWLINIAYINYRFSASSNPFRKL